jgi:hypothetical protein
MAGFLFADEHEASVFYKKVMGRDKVKYKKRTLSLMVDVA